MCTIIHIFTKTVINESNYKQYLKLDSKENLSKSSNLSHYDLIKERIEARFGDALPAHFIKAMKSPQAKPYMHGDPHNVTYKKRTSNFNAPMPVPCEVTLESCQRLPNGSLVLGMDCHNGIDEPFPWVDAKYQVSLNFLRSLPNGTELTINTRSDVIATEDYISELKRLNVKVRMLYTTENSNLSRITEPGAPSPQRRKVAVEVLNASGVCASFVKHIPKAKNKKKAS